MKKRILAALLVLCMLVSVLPMTALAVEEECTIEVHNLKTCPDAIEVGVVDPVCDDWGYTLYECPVCHEQFAADFTEYEGEHVWEYIEKRLPAAATCTEEGYEPAKICKVCGLKVESQILPVIKHDYAPMYSEEKGCYGKCRVCGLETDGAAHVWGNPVLTEDSPEPACGVVGEAVYTCENCGLEKFVPVYTDHELTDVKEIPASCLEDGRLAHQYCELCKVYWLNGEVVTAEDLVIPGEHVYGWEFVFEHEDDGHSWEAPADGTIIIINITPDEYSSVDICGDMELSTLRNSDVFEDYSESEYEGERYWYLYELGTSSISETAIIVVDVEEGAWIDMDSWCCGDEYIEQVVVIAYVDSETLNLKDARCGGGTADVLCNVCGKAPVNVELPENHQYELVFAEDPTCTLHGYELWVCRVCGDSYDETTPFYGHSHIDTYAEYLAYMEEYEGENDAEYLNDISNYTAPTCDDDGDAYWYCPECGKYFEEDFPALGHNIVAVEIPASCYSYGYTVYFCDNYPCSKGACEEDGLGFSWRSDISLDADKDGEAEIYRFGADILRVCGEKVYNKATNLNVYFHKIEVNVEGGLNPNLHPTEDLVLDSVIKEPTCTENGSAVYWCPHCIDFVVLPLEATGHEFSEQYINEAGEHIWYEGWDCIGKTYFGICDVCDERVDFETIPALELPLYYTPENFGEYHFLWSNRFEDWTNCVEVLAEASCTKRGLEKWHCPACNEDHLVVIEPNGHYGDAWVDAKEATCEEGGWNAHGICDSCGIEVEKVDSPALGHDWSVEAQAPKCNVPGWYEHGVCANCQEELDKEDVMRDALTHEWNEIEVYEKDCNQFAGVLLKCGNCGIEEIHYYEPAAHNWVLNEEKSYDATCTTNGLEYYDCIGCEGKCTEKKEVVVECLGYHINKDDVKIDPIACDDCNGTTDRDCVNCDEDLSLDYIHHDMTCVDDEYDIYTCPVCGEEDVINVVERPVDKDGNYILDGLHQWKHKTVDGWVVNSENSGLEERWCVLCGLHETRIVDAIAINVESAAGVVTYGDTVKIAISIEGLINVWGFQFDVLYNEEELEFAGYKFVSENFYTNAMANVIDVDDSEEGVDNVVRIAAHCFYEFGFDILLNGTEDIVVLTFKVIADSACVSNVSVDEASIDVLNAANEDVTANAGNVDVVIGNFADCNGDGKIGLAEIKYIYDLISGNLKDDEGNVKTYDSCVDVDKDGFVKTNDMVLIYRYMMGLISYADLLAASAQ